MVRTGNVAVDFLQTNHIRILGADDFDHAFEPVSPIASSDALVNVVTENSDHKASLRIIRRRGAGAFWPATLVLLCLAIALLSHRWLG